MAFTPSPASTSWASQFLQVLGITPTDTNVRQVAAWEQAESGGVGSYNNPLNTTLHEPGSFGVNYNNGYPVQGYTSMTQGLQADATALTSGVGKYSHYSNILADLQSGNASDATFAGDIAASPWGTGAGVGRVLGVTPAPGATATLTSTPTPLDPFGLNPLGAIANGVTNGNPVTNAVGGAITSAIQGLIAPIVKPLENAAVRTGLVIFGAIAVLVGVATMVKGGGADVSDALHREASGGSRDSSSGVAPAAASGGSRDSSSGVAPAVASGGSRDSSSGVAPAGRVNTSRQTGNSRPAPTQRGAKPGGSKSKTVVKTAKSDVESIGEAAG